MKQQIQMESFVDIKDQNDRVFANLFKIEQISETFRLHYLAEIQQDLKVKEVKMTPISSLKRIKISLNNLSDKFPNRQIPKKTKIFKET